MKITKKSAPVVHFKDLNFGDVFQSPSSRNYFIKTETIYCNGVARNSVRLKDGGWFSMEEHECFVSVNCELVIH